MDFADGVLVEDYGAVLLTHFGGCGYCIYFQYFLLIFLSVTLFELFLYYGLG